jgi:hypothetical protein
MCLSMRLQAGCWRGLPIYGAGASVFPGRHASPTHEGAAEAAGIPVSECCPDLRNIQVRAGKKGPCDFVAHFVNEIGVSQLLNFQLALQGAAADPQSRGSGWQSWIAKPYHLRDDVF